MSESLQRIGKYDVIRKLGEGATSEVYLCADPFNDRQVAVKVVFEDRLVQSDGGKLARKLKVRRLDTSHAPIAPGIKNARLVMTFQKSGTPKNVR